MGAFLRRARGLLKKRHVCFSVDFDEALMPVKYSLPNPTGVFMEAVGLCWHAHCQHPGHLLLQCLKWHEQKADGLLKTRRRDPRNQKSHGCNHLAINALQRLWKWRMVNDEWCLFETLPTLTQMHLSEAI